MKEVVEQVVLNSAVIDPDIRLITDVEEVFFDGLLEGWRVAIENIMENAFRYAKTYIKIVVRENDIRIYNDGPKMPEDRIETLFKPYEKGEGGRFGLGLSIVSKVTKTNHYIVKGYNTDDGVCFRIYRPVTQKKDIREGKTMLEVGTIGSGIIVDRMIDAIKQVNGIRLNAVYSRNEERAMEFAKSHEADRFFWDLDQFISDPDLDVIYIASPNSLHYEQAKKL